MAIKTILVLADGGSGTAATLTTAVTVARRFSASLDVLHVRADVETMVPVIGEGMSGAMVEQMMSAMQQTVESRASKAKAAHDQVCGAAGVQAVWRERTGRETDIVANAGRLADLIIVGKPNAESETPLAATLDAALFDTGRPVLVAPTAATAIGSRIAIAWNGSAQAARVVAGSMPFLRTADRVMVLTVGEIGRSASATDLVAYLARHDVRAEHEALAADHRVTTGAALLEHAGKTQCDLLVMGAYGHSRLREMILGGATRDVLAAAALPVLMAH
jgi:nucleotide-binding universal stress UspA family protein